MSMQKKRKRNNLREFETQRLISVLSIALVVSIGILTWLELSATEDTLTEPTVEAPATCGIRDGNSRDVRYEIDFQNPLDQLGYLAVVELWRHDAVGQRIVCTQEELMRYTTEVFSFLFPYVTFYVDKTVISSPEVMGQHIRVVANLLETHRYDLANLNTVTIRFVYGGDHIDWQASYYYTAPWRNTDAMTDIELFEFGTK